jgi:hypothetical protein
VESGPSTTFSREIAKGNRRRGDLIANQPMKLTGAAILVPRGMKVLQAAPAAYPYHSETWETMRVAYCWRCKEEVPMLDEQEYDDIMVLLTAANDESPDYLTAFGIAKDAAVDELLRPVFDVYEKMTGIRPSNTDRMLHHRLSLFGPPCSKCGKLLRTPRAKKCLMCGMSE